MVLLSLPSRTASKRFDGRTRRDRRERHKAGFDAQISSMVDAYMLWRKELGERTLADASPGEVLLDAEDTGDVVVFDIFCE
jgi:hypothetical protein